MPPKPLNQKLGDLEQLLEKKMSQIASKGKSQDAEELAKTLGLPFSDLAGTPIDPEALSLLTEDAARSSRAAIIYRSGKTLIVAVADPRDPETRKTLDELRAQGFQIKETITTRQAMEKAWERYSSIKTVEFFEAGAIDIKEEDLAELQSKVTTLSDLKDQITQVSATKLLEILIAGALKTKASDIHFEPEKDKTRLRYRLDGILNDVTDIEKNVYNRVLNRIKVLSKLKLNIHKAPQDGRFTIREKNLSIEVRVSILPSEYGETIVMRLLDPRGVKAKLEDLGMRPDLLELVKQQINKPNGALFTTGPTGSGKTTSLYAFANFLNTPDMKIITVEDPIEYHIEGISQTQVDAAKGYTFASGLRSIVRQDPDVILIGEIRDFETADMALNAALTGHLVLSTIHTNDAAGTIPRLIDMGAKPEIIAPALATAMGQRLLRRLCQSCKKKGTLPAKEAERIQKEMANVVDRFKLPKIDTKLTVYTPVGCTECNGLGYKGRIGVYEIFTVTPTVERLIMSSPGVSDIRDLAVKEGMVTMLQDGYLKLIGGITALDEIRRILG